MVVLPKVPPVAPAAAEHTICKNTFCKMLIKISFTKSWNQRWMLTFSTLFWSSFGLICPSSWAIDVADEIKTWGLEAANAGCLAASVLKSIVVLETGTPRWDNLSKLARLDFWDQAKKWKVWLSSDNDREIKFLLNYAVNRTELIFRMSTYWGHKIHVAKIMQNMSFVCHLEKTWRILSYLWSWRNWGQGVLDCAKMSLLNSK